MVWRAHACHKGAWADPPPGDWAEVETYGAEGVGSALLPLTSLQKTRKGSERMSVRLALHMHSAQLRVAVKSLSHRAAKSVMK